MSWGLCENLSLISQEKYKNVYWYFALFFESEEPYEELLET